MDKRGRYTGTISPNILAAANNGGVIFATPDAFYEIRKIDLKNGHQFTKIVADEYEAEKTKKHD